MNPDYEGRFDFEDILAFNKSDLTNSEQLGAHDDNDVVLTWEISLGAEREAREWLYENRAVITDVELPHGNLTGTFRLSKVVAKEIESTSTSKYKYVLIATYSKGYYTSLDWSSGRPYSNGLVTPGNSVDSGLTNGASDNPRSIVFIKLPYINPENSDSVAASAVAAGSINNTSVAWLDDAYTVISASVVEEQDLYHSVIVIAAKPKYVLTAYQSLWAVAEATTVHLWKIPEAQAQGIINEWRSLYPQGASAIPQYNGDGYVDMVLKRFANEMVDSLDWTTARLWTSFTTPGNDSAAKDADGVDISNTASDKPRNIIQLKLPFINPEEANRIAIEIVETQEIDFAQAGVPVIAPGIYKIISAAVDIEEEVFASIIVTAALPQFTLEAYSDYGGIDEAVVTYLWQVPEALSQGIITAWRTAHPVSASASVDYQTTGYVNIILRRKANTTENLSIEGFRILCDTVVNYHFAWGYPEANIQAFLDAHNSTPTNSTQGMAGVTKEISIQTRGDGLFDIIIKEAVRTFEEDKHVVFLDTYTGTGITHQQQFGWYLPKNQLDNYKNEYDAANKVVNQKSEFNVTRHDDCTFDYRGVVEIYNAIELSASSTGAEGVSVAVEAGRYIEQANIPAPASAKRKRIQIILEPNDLGSASYTIVSNTVKEIADQQTNDGGRKYLQVFKNADAIPASPSASYRYRSASVSPNDDATFDGAMLWQDVTAVASSKDFGNGRKLYYGQWATSIPSGSAGEKFQAGSVNIDDDGLFQYSLWFKTTATPTTASWNDGVTLFTRANSAAVNDVPANIPTPGATIGSAEEVQAVIDPEEGTARWNRQSVTSVDSTEIGGGVMRSNGFVKETVVKRRNAAIADLPTIADGVRGEVEFEILETKRLNYIKKTLEADASISTVRTSTSSERIEYMADFPKHESSVSSRYTATNGHGWETKITTFLLADVPITRRRYVYRSVVEEFSLSALSAETVSSPDGGLGGEQTSTVDIVGDGLWRRTKVTEEYGPWETMNAFITWVPYANDLIETSSD